MTQKTQLDLFLNASQAAGIALAAKGAAGVLQVKLDGLRDLNPLDHDDWLGYFDNELQRFGTLSRNPARSAQVAEAPAAPAA